MGIARELVELAARMRSEGFDSFGPEAAERLRARPDAARLSEALPPTMAASDAISLALQSLSIQLATLEPKLVQAEFVATLPSNLTGLARPTRHVIAEMLSGHPREVVIVGYEISDDSFVAMLHEVASGGTALTIIADRKRGSIERLLASWPSSLTAPQLFIDRERPDSTEYASMHCKTLLVDGDDLLITSANLTFHGLRENIEFGVRLHGAPAAEARRVFDHLVRSGLLEQRTC
jgi:phosphatidylserine/phosphatidylglycerophosphate/cardiolipin synthase-like enzyme